MNQPPNYKFKKSGQPGEDGSVMITGRNIDRFQLITVRSAIKLEKLGMKHSHGSVKARWAAHLGLKPKAKHDEVIAKINELLKDFDGPA